MELTLQALAETEQTGVIAVSDAVFAAEYKLPLITQVVKACMAARHTGTRAQKNRARVRGGGAKPWRQKGTGRARAGTSRSPLWRGGGVTFAAVPTVRKEKLNKKMFRGAMRSILSELIRQNRLMPMDSFEIAEPKTRELVNKLKSVEAAKLLIVTRDAQKNLELAARNLYRVRVSTTAGLNPVSLIDAEKVIITVSALKQLEERLQ
ncbi:MAG: 50S ribosomal protein L4 [Gammaproteobacteria bacterium]|nr:50S ribosomal protein L4 [Gammaproteobacteria bacterium]